MVGDFGLLIHTENGDIEASSKVSPCAMISYKSVDLPVYLSASKAHTFYNLNIGSWDVGKY